MIEPKFEVSIGDNGLVYTEPLNKEGEKLKERVISLFPNENLIKFILASPNSMDIDENKNLIYEIDIYSIEDTIEDLKNREF